MARSVEKYCSTLFTSALTRSNAAAKRSNAAARLRTGKGLGVEYVKNHESKTWRVESQLDRTAGTQG